MSDSETPSEEVIQKLIDEFKAGEDYYSSEKFKEHNIRKDFINPVFEALGWDVRNLSRKTYDREVEEEDSLVVEGKVKAPDYAFRISGKKRFFVEAKKPAINIEHDQASAFQLRRYSWTAGFALGILTDFEEWSVYDCRFQPQLTDPASVGRILHFRYSELLEHWDFLVALFGKISVQSGSIDDWAEREKAPKGSLHVDDAFLSLIKQWRRDLAVSISEDHPALTAPQLNKIVQDLIDRIIFLRIAEARGIETLEELKNAVSHDDAYERLVGLFRRADDRYNSGLFHFSKEKGRGYADTISPSLVVRSEILQSIVRALYYPFPYEFSVMPADILGRVYEQFLGETITVESGHVVVDTKPEVRKAGGVYYTPEPIVDYIVEAAIGPLVEGSTPEKVAKLRILDPACGSGSFLIAAYQFLIDWHTRYYETHKKRYGKFLEFDGAGVPRLSTEERRRILLNNIYGVDIDRQAVEVTKLSLLLKVIEGQTQVAMVLDKRNRLLPDLDSNICAGNSLIGTDFPQTLKSDPAEIAAVSPFSWSHAFPSVIGGGKKFDAVIGNPPYLNIDSTWGKGDPRVAYLKSAYPYVHTDKTDILFYFLAKSADICEGEIAMIVSRSFLEADKAVKLRSWLASNTRVREVLDFRDALVFRAGINTAIVHLSKSASVKESRFRRYTGKAMPPGYQAKTLRDSDAITEVVVELDQLSGGSWNFGQEADRTMIEKIDAAGIPIGEVLRVGKGMETALNEAFTIPHDSAVLLQTALESGLAMRRVRTRDIDAYRLRDSGPMMLYLEDIDSFEKLPKVIREHLQTFEHALRDRAAFKRGDCEWWKYSFPLHSELVHNPKIISPYRSRTNRFAVDSGGNYFGSTDTTILYQISPTASLWYISAVLNSPVAEYRHRFLGKLAGGGTYEYFANTVSKLPVPSADKPNELTRKIGELGESLALHNLELHSTKSQTEIASLDAKIRDIRQLVDELVFDLFELTHSERAHIRSTLA